MLRISNHFVSTAVAILLLFESLILVGSAYLAVPLRFTNTSHPFSGDFSNFFLTALIFALVMIFSMSALGMYQISFREGVRSTVSRLVPSSVLAFVLITLIFYIFPEIYVGRGVVGFMFLVAIPAITLTRFIFFKSTKAKFLQSRVMFLGSGALAQECGTLAEESRVKHKYHIVGYVAVANEECCVPSQKLLPVDGSLMDMVFRYDIDEIVVTIEDRRGGALHIRDLLACKLSGIKVIDSAAFFEREACQIRVDSLQPSWLVFGNGFDQGYFRAACKKGFDILVSLAVLIVALPILLITALFIFLEDHGPVFYRQERVGKNGRHFMVLKFRSMGTDAECAGTPQWAATNDPRTTKVGRIIRLLRIDEFPQIINVLKGDMSFVGPRPERPYFVEQLCEEVPYYNFRHSIKPGITGMAQVRYQYGASVADALQKLQYDLYYVKNNSFFLDMLILIDTLQVVILGKGSR
ncbi:MAG: TIGR03013 family XrtA/PEP-CTERM system glycosyltransferase [Herbaspirillum sp.]